jgi:regulatory protein
MKTISSDWTANLPDDQQRARARLLQDARTKAIAFLGLARKPTGQVAKCLAEQGFDQDIIKDVLKDLEADGYLDDLRLARRIVSQRQTGRQAESRTALRRRMMDRGLSGTAIDEALAEVISDREAATGLLAARFAGEWPTRDRRKLQKMARFLAGRGFSADMISQLLLSRYDEAPLSDDDDTGFSGYPDS